MCMIVIDEIIKEHELSFEKKLSFSYEKDIDQKIGKPNRRLKECSPSSSSLRTPVPKGRINSALRSGDLPSRFVPVVDSYNKPLMPTKRSRAFSWIKSRKATPFYVRGIFCVRLNTEPSARNFQDIACGIDPGSKKEGYTLKSASHTYLNIQADAVTWVKQAMEVRQNMRKGRRFRNTPYREKRINRKQPGSLPPSTKARWAWKLRIVNVLLRMFTITIFVVEDITGGSRKGQRRWNASFSPLEVGKKWFYQETKKLGKLITKKGYETKELRDNLGLIKSKKKLEESWNAHCVDSWVLARFAVGGSEKPDNTDVIYIAPIRLNRRQLHKFQPAPGGERRRHGGTRSLGLKRGSRVKHKKYGVVYIGGYHKTGISLHCIETGKRVIRSGQAKDCTILTWNTWKSWKNHSEESQNESRR